MIVFSLKKHIDEIRTDGRHDRTKITRVDFYMSDYQIHRGMKAKTIKAVLAKKFKSWVDTIEDPEVQKLVQKNTIITGGCIASMLLGEMVNDYDIYFADQATAKAVAQYYVARFEVKNRKGIPCEISVDDTDGRIKIVVKSSGIASENGTTTEYQYFESQPDESAQGYVSEIMSDAGSIQDTYEETEDMAQEVEDGTYRPVFLSTNAITLSNRIQLIIRFQGDPAQIHENFDFVHATNYWTSKDNALTLRPEALEALLSRELRYVGSKYPICSVIRLRKFLKRGWVINAGQILKMMLQISELDLTNIEVLQEQLTGVDSAYFISIIKDLREKNPDKVDQSYLCEIINRMF
jgi:hypothetical protein